MTSFDFQPGVWQEGLSGKGEGKGCAWKKSLAVPWEAGPLCLMPVYNPVLKTNKTGDSSMCWPPSKDEGALEFL